MVDCDSWKKIVRNPAPGMTATAPVSPACWCRTPLFVLQWYPKESSVGLAPNLVHPSSLSQQRSTMIYLWGENRCTLQSIDSSIKRCQAASMLPVLTDFAEAPSQASWLLQKKNVFKYGFKMFEVEKNVVWSHKLWRSQQARSASVDPGPPCSP